MVCTLGIFALLIGMMPSNLLTYQTYYNAPSTQDQAVVDYFTAENITLYKSTWSFTIAEGGAMHYLDDVPQVDHRIECFWGSWGTSILEFRHAFPSWLLGWAGVFDSHRLIPIDPYLTRMAAGSPGYPELGLYNYMHIYNVAVNNSAFFEMKCEHVKMNVVIRPSNQSATLQEAWFDYENLTVLSSYEIDFEGMKPNAWALITQLVTFQEPELGIPGDFGAVLTYIFGVGFWVVVAILIYTILTKIIPTVSGGIEG